MDTEIPKQNLLAYCDNQATVDIINTGKAKNSFAQSCLREVCYLTALNNTVVKVVHRRGVDNRICDYLSCWHLSPVYEKKFKEIVFSKKGNF